MTKNLKQIVVNNLVGFLIWYLLWFLCYIYLFFYIWEYHVNIKNAYIKVDIFVSAKLRKNLKNYRVLNEYSVQFLKVKSNYKIYNSN